MEDPRHHDRQCEQLEVNGCPPTSLQDSYWAKEELAVVATSDGGCTPLEAIPMSDGWRDGRGLVIVRDSNSIEDA